MHNNHYPTHLPESLTYMVYKSKILFWSINNIKTTNKYKKHSCLINITNKSNNKLQNKTFLSKFTNKIF